MPLTGRTLRRQGGEPNSAGMAAVFRLLTLFAFVLMPFTMAPAEAHAMPQGIAEGHCDDRQQPELPKQVNMAQCMLMCAALPAAEPLTVFAPGLPKTPLQLDLIKPIHGIILEIATPPPRPS